MTSRTMIGQPLYKGLDDEEDSSQTENWTGTVRLDYNAGECRTSLRLKVQNDTVFIVNYDTHGPWNVVEHDGRIMTKKTMRHVRSAA